MTDARRILMVGLPSSGKSTFIGALWQIIQDATDESITEVDVTGDRSYLQSLGERVASVEEVDRTDVGSTEGLLLRLLMPEVGQIMLDLPDLSGENLRTLVEERFWTDELASQIQVCSGLLFFVSPITLSLPVRADFINSVIASAGPQDQIADADETPTFEIRDACTAARLIDAFQNIGAQLNGRVRCAVIVSAWDSVASATPAGWLHQRLPALEAFLSTNSDKFEVSLFGMSAQGGALPADRASLLEKASVLERAYVRDQSGAKVDFVSPLRWVLS